MPSKRFFASFKSGVSHFLLALGRLWMHAFIYATCDCYMDNVVILWLLMIQYASNQQMMRPIQHKFKGRRYELCISLNCRHILHCSNTTLKVAKPERDSLGALVLLHMTILKVITMFPGKK